MLPWFEADDFEAVMQRSAEMASRRRYLVIEALPLVTAGPITGSVGCGTDGYTVAVATRNGGRSVASGPAQLRPISSLTVAAGRVVESFAPRD